MPDSRRVAIVTGGSRGIGRAIALQLSRDGLAVAINYRSRSDAANQVYDAILSAGGEAIVCAGDIGDLDDHARIVDQTLARWGRVDVLVNNAGITSPGRNDVLETTPEAWDAVLATNLKGPFFFSQLVANKQLELQQAGVIAGGYLINISSISAFAVSLNRPEYCVAKAGMAMMTQLFAARLADAGIYVFEVCPGVIASDMTAPVQEKYERLIREGLSPIRRWGQPEDVARAVSMLAAGALPFSTGERIHVDGGFHIRRL